MPLKRSEVWLSANRRILVLAMLPVLALDVLGAILLVNYESVVLRAIAWGILAISTCLLVGLVQQFSRPRIGYRNGQVLFYLKAGAPIGVPTEVVEAFFLGQGPAFLPGQKNQKTETVNLVARISQRAPEWAKQNVKPALGRWCDGYVTIRGTWCEPLTGQVIRRLNKLLGEVTRSQQSDESVEASR